MFSIIVSFAGKSELWASLKEGFLQCDALEDLNCRRLQFLLVRGSVSPRFDQMIDSGIVEYSIPSWSKTPELPPRCIYERSQSLRSRHIQKKTKLTKQLPTELQSTAQSALLRLAESEPRVYPFTLKNSSINTRNQVPLEAMRAHASHCLHPVLQMMFMPRLLSCSKSVSSSPLSTGCEFTSGFRIPMLHLETAPELLTLISE